MLRLVLGFLPWIILAVFAGRWFISSLLLAFAVAAITTTRQYWRGTPKILDTVTCVFFAGALAAVAIVGWIPVAIHMTMLVNVTLTIIAWGSLLAGTPFTIQYAREQVPQEHWHSPIFIRINQYITAAWGLDFLLSLLISLYKQTTGETNFVVNYAWMLFSVAAVLFTVYFPDWYKSRALRRLPQTAGHGSA